ncbi:hypothetical protein ACFWP7_32730 [Streptomyces sp. NPDC058470]|uniref:hypothetical protein n=1 Tax=Streptomyces sp. NPDC058470 TaxID=3346515 RepID=UPI00364909A2
MFRRGARNGAVCPGGFRLAEADIDIRGDRGQVLCINYRNAKQILDTALAVVAEDAFEDIEAPVRQGTGKWTDPPGRGGNCRPE